MTPSTKPRGRRLIAGATVAALTAGVLAFAPAAQAADSSTITDGTISWGLKSSFRSYLGSPVAHGAITAGAPATDTGTQTVFPQATGSWGDSSASVGAKGSVRYTGHEGALDLTISDPRIVVTGTSAQLVVDAVDSDDQTHDDVAFATINLAGKVTSTDSQVTIAQAPTTITAAGSALLSYQGSAFYPAGTALDPIDASFTAKAAPKVSVSKVTFGADETATVTVTGSGFDPQAAVGMYPPFSGTASGYYVVFGKFAEQWRPSSGAKRATRKNSSQKWTLPQQSYDTLVGMGPVYAEQAVLMNADGTFSAELTVSKAAIDAIATDPSLTNYGIYTYPGGGAVVPEAETYTPVSFVSAAAKATNVSARYAKGGSVTVTAPVPGTITVAGLGTKTATTAGAKVTFAFPRTWTAGTRTLRVSFAPADTGLTAPAATTATVKITKVAAYKAKIKVTKKPTRKAKGKAVVSVKGVSGGAAPTGKVRLKLTKGKTNRYVNVNLVKGKRTVSLPKLAKGTWTVRAAYYGNANYTKRGYAKIGSIKVTK